MSGAPITTPYNTDISTHRQLYISTHFQQRSDFLRFRKAVKYVDAIYPIFIAKPCSIGVTVQRKWAIPRMRFYAVSIDFLLFISGDGQASHPHDDGGNAYGQTD